MGQSTADAFATFLQRRGKGKSKSKGKKGRGKGKSPPSSSYPDLVSAQRLPFSASGEITLEQKKERAARIKALRVRIQCSDCGQFGHWRGDPECPDAVC
jgi:hypothetical protein